MEKWCLEAQPEEKRDGDGSHCDTREQVEQGIDYIGWCPGLTAVELFQHKKLRDDVVMWKWAVEVDSNVHAKNHCAAEASVSA